MAEQDNPREFILGHLKFLRDDFQDEIPPDIIHSDSPKKRFKVRRGWFQGVVADLYNAIDVGLITDPNAVREVNEFIDYATGEEFKSRERTTSEDIQKANKILDLVLGEKKQ